MDPQNTAPETPLAPEMPAAPAAPAIPQPETYTPAPGEPRLGRAAMPEAAAKKSSGVGPMVGAIIVIAILIAGALYFLGTGGMLPMGSSVTPQDQQGTAMSTADDSSGNVDSQASAADADMSTLEADLGASMNELDASMQTQ